ncbi:DUF382-domain-containing protein [Atractiella rhizophila]|nr:DUF382-domain-containing protein [Atractiella rhizophila]
MSSTVLASDSNSKAGAGPKTRGARKRLKQKEKKEGKLLITPSNATAPVQELTVPSAPEPKKEEEDEAFDDFMDEDEQKDEITQAFESVFSRFQILETPTEGQNTETQGTGGENGKGEVIYSDEEVASDEEDKEPVISKRKLKRLNRLSVAELKRIVKRPDVVEWVDVTAADPRLLVQIKSHKNTIPIPQHWSQKRDYLQGKRGIEKPQFQLPSFIADTGIATQRDAVKEKEETMSLKAKTRERVQPKMGKIDIDYQKLHDAFFKFQTKPPMTVFGEMYYEGKEFETKLKEKRPGDLSDELKEALSIPPLAPPPWLISMQRYGPPPSYPALKIPGLNCPIPEGAQWGFHPGGWGKPPVDEYQRPLYRDVLGGFPMTMENDNVNIDKALWGELEPEEEESEEEEEEEGEEVVEATSASREALDGIQTPSGLETPSGLASVTSTVPGGLETPDFLDIRKRREATEADDGREKSLYTVVPEKKASIQGLMGSSHVYDLRRSNSTSVLGEERGTKRKAGVDVTLSETELEGMSEEQLKERYESARRAGSTVNVKQVDTSDVYVEESRKRQKREESRKERAKDKDSFKF